MDHQNTDQAELLSRLDRLLNEDWVADAPVENRPEQPSAEPAAEEKTEKPVFRTELLLPYLKDICLVLAALTVVFVFLTRWVVVEGDSMYPTLLEGDRLILRNSLWYRTPEKGDVVVLRVSEYGDEALIKRVIATGGDTVDIDFEKGIVYVNGEALSEDYINEKTYKQYENGTVFPLTVDPGKIFVLGDNRNHSIDSRYAALSQVDNRCVLGKVLLLVYPGKDENTGHRAIDRLGTGWKED